MKCITCGTECQLFKHDYYEGTLQKPKRIWTITAPLYFLGDRPFCSPVCATLGHDVGELQHIT